MTRNLPPDLFAYFQDTPLETGFTNGSRVRHGFTACGKTRCALDFGVARRFSAAITALLGMGLQPPAVRTLARQRLFPQPLRPCRLGPQRMRALHFAEKLGFVSGYRFSDTVIPLKINRPFRGWVSNFYFFSNLFTTGGRGSAPRNRIYELGTAPMKS